MLLSLMLRAKTVAGNPSSWPCGPRSNSLIPQGRASRVGFALWHPRTSGGVRSHAGVSDTPGGEGIATAPERVQESSHGRADLDRLHARTSSHVRRRPHNKRLKPTAGRGALDQLEKQPVAPAAPYPQR